jgi:hypothetical protein
MTRGRSLAERARMNLRTPSAASEVVRIVEGVQAADVARLGRVEQRYRDPAGVQRAEEGAEVVQVLRAQDGDAIARLGDLLQPGAHGAVAGAEIGPGDVTRDAVPFGGEVQKSVGQPVATNLRPLLNVTNQVHVVREADLSIHDERVVVRHAAFSPVTTISVGFADLHSVPASPTYISGAGRADGSSIHEPARHALGGAGPCQLRPRSGPQRSSDSS